MIVETCKGWRDPFDGVSNWASLWNAPTISNPTPVSRKAIQVTPNAANDCIVQTVKSFTNGRVIARVRQGVGSTARPIGIATRVAGGSSAREGWIFRLLSTGANISRLQAGGTLSSQVSQSSRVHVAGTWYWFDILQVGTVHRFQVWPDGEARPAGWLLNLTNANSAGPGRVAIYCGAAADNVQCDKLITTIL